jgi:hypothetical protein
MVIFLTPPNRRLRRLTAWARSQSLEECLFADRHEGASLVCDGLFGGTHGAQSTADRD